MSAHGHLNLTLTLAHRAPAACNVYHLPVHVILHVELITPGINFSAVLLKHSTQFRDTHPAWPAHNALPVLTSTVHTILDELSMCNTQITPMCLCALYGLVFMPVLVHHN
ncbi:hypothetical protein B0H10DRAFT_1786898 [Mycena sp. CBHHK59/15]|nr:hypothetical protein B0H10DRAFT_1786898 [Mycena sp. CBHHK59/15]